VSVDAGSEAELRFGGAEALWPGSLQVLEQGRGFIELGFPQVVRGRAPIYAIKFRTRIFLNSTTFFVELSNSARSGVVQVASDGDVSALAGSQSMVVVTDLLRAPLLGDLRVEPRVFTPNGDGINDEAQLLFSVFRLEGEAAFSVRAYDLSGRSLRDLSFVRPHASGAHSLAWDGRDDEGRLVAPGVYLLRVDFAADADEDLGFTVPVHVVY
jgi:hypothetical protein